MLPLRAPTHKIDGVGVFIASADCWDTARIDAEINAAIEASEAVKLAAAAGADPSSVVAEIRDAHPVVRYQKGLTRFQLDAPDHTLAGEPITARAYLAGEPTEFVMQRLPWETMERIRSVEPVRLQLAEYARRSVAEIRGGELRWERSAKDALVPGDIMQAIWDVGVLLELGVAARTFSGPLMEHEGKR